MFVDPGSDGDDVKEETVFAEADKWFLVQRLPPVLTLHLKRFEQQGMMRVTKNNRHMTFPLLLDMAPYCTHDSEVCRMWWGGMCVGLWMGGWRVGVGSVGECGWLGGGWGYLVCYGVGWGWVLCGVGWG